MSGIERIDFCFRTRPDGSCEGLGIACNYDEEWLADQRECGTCGRYVLVGSKQIYGMIEHGANLRVSVDGDFEAQPAKPVYCVECKAKEAPMIVPTGWHHHSLRGERESMWPMLCPTCGNRKARAVPADNSEVK